jgi:hypothetical protein
MQTIGALTRQLTLVAPLQVWLEAGPTIGTKGPSTDRLTRGAHLAPIIKQAVALEPDPLSRRQVLVTPHGPEALRKLLQQAPLPPALLGLGQMVG